MLSIYIVNLLHTGARKLRTAASDGTYEDGKSTRNAVMKFVAVTLHDCVYTHI